MDSIATQFLQERFNKTLGNDVVSGGLVLILIGSMLAFMHYLLGLAWDRFKRYLFVSLEVRKEDECYEWIMAWLAEMNKTQYTRDLSVVTMRERDEYGNTRRGRKPCLSFAPAPGLHFIWYNGRYISVTRTVKENQFAGGAGRTGLELNETLRLTTYGTDVGVLKCIADKAMKHSLGQEEGKTLIFKPRKYHDGSWRKVMAVEKRSI